MKKLLITLTLILTLCLTAFTLTACSSKEGHTHEYSIEYTYDNEYHWLECDCGDKTNIKAHNYTEVKHNETQHWYECVCGCDLKQNYGEHTPDSLQMCTSCDYAIPTEGVVYQVSLDGSYATVVGYEGTSEIVNIAETYQNVPVKTIGKWAFFYRAFERIFIPDGVTHIEEEAFMGSYLGSISIPNSVTYISDLAFSYYPDVECYNVEGNLKYLGNSSNKYLVLMGTTDTFVSSVSINENCKFIYSFAFRDCYQLETVIMPDSVISIGTGVFERCPLKNITIPDSLIHIGQYTLNSTNLQINFNIEDNLVYVGSTNNKYLILAGTIDDSISSITINENCKIIYSRAFANCTELKSITIPNSVVCVGGLYFAPIVETIYCEAESQPSDWDCCDWKGVQSVVWGHEIKDEMKEDTDSTGLQYRLINGNTEYEVVGYNGNSKGVEIPATYKDLPITSIGANAFYNCDFLTTIVMPDSVTSFGDYAFAGCTLLRDITIPSDLTFVGKGAIDNCDSLELKFYVKNKVVYLGSQNNEYLIAVGTIDDSISSLKINENCKIIYSGAFENCVELTSITFPNSVISIGENAFANCTELISITIPSSVTSIGENAFLSCAASLSSIVVDESNTKYYSKDNCLIETATNSLILGCNNSIIPNNVTSIGSYAFSCCDKFTSIVIPDSVTVIGNYAFEGCDSLTTITFGKNVASIGKNAFMYCTSLKTIIIPRTVTSIDKSLFYRCSNLETIYCEAESQPEGWSYYWNYYCDAKVVWGYKKEN